MSGCPHHKVRSDLPPLTDRIAKLPVDARGYPVPFFVVWLDDKGEQCEPGTGTPEFRRADRRKLMRCLKEKLCWVCGEKLGAHLAFTIGPMCAVNRVTSEPPTHLECAQWSVKGCPFLAKPQMVRREDETLDKDAPGIMFEGNPGVMVIWVAKSFEPFWAGNGLLLRLGDYVDTPTWWREGRPATKEEVIAAIDAGCPRLISLCRDEEERTEIKQDIERVKAMVMQ